MNYTIKCPFCAEEINSEANICKHCQKKISTSEPRKNINLQIEKIEIQKLNEELKDKIVLYPEKLRKNIINNKKNLEKLRNLDNNGILQDIFIKERNGNIKILLIISLFLLFIFPPALLITVWLYPKKDEKEILKNRIKDFKNFKGRIVLSIFVLIIGFSIFSSNIKENNKKAEEIKRQELVKNTSINTTFDIKSDSTDKESIGIKIELQNINKLTINNNEIRIGSGNIVNYILPLSMGENKISIIGFNGDIKKETNKIITRVSNDEFKKLEAENNKKIEEERIKQEELAKQEQERTQKEERDKKVQTQFSAWDGSHINLTKYVKGLLKDPDSYEHINTKYSTVKNKDNSYSVVVFMSYRAKNSFGGFVVENIKAYFDLDGNPVNMGNWIQG
ncbi:hypothetical protein M0P65_06265 [Candidatus Gracilibacteria bacterium]|nr:hypothetical protein [Candidatus Gracilibacteria bacterium]